MSVVRGTSPYARLPWGLLGMIALAFAIEHLISSHTLELTRPEYWDWRSSSSAVRRQTRDVQVLCFGTSRMQQALVPQVFETTSGLRAWNLATCWGQPAGYYYLLKRALDHGARPAAVLVEYHPKVLSENYWDTIRYWPDLLKPGEILDLSWTARDPEFFAHAFLAYQLASIKDRFQIRTNVLAALRGKPEALATLTLAYLRNRNRNRGAMIQPPNPGYHGEIAPPYYVHFVPESWSCNSVNARFIQRFLDLAASRGILVYWVLPPYCPELFAERQRRGLDVKFEAFVRHWQSRYPNVVVLDAERSQYGPEAFNDASHLSRPGACALSADIGELARTRTKASAGPLWVQLPKYRDRPPSVAVEDLAVSANQIHARLTTKR
jgi:hypothetical protein